jgi:(p)ppGpp synthase/HD superfamily hydrolase
LNAAQTNLQLYAQLAERGFAGSDLAALRRAYDLATSLFAGVYRASGKPFVAHLVGTASLLAAQGAPARLVTAGLLHSAYSHGDFGDGPRGRTRRRAARLAAAVGEEVEGLIARYEAFPWKTSDANPRSGWPASLGPLDRDVLTMRLANELEELLDFDILYSEDAEARREEAVRELPTWIRWAIGLSADGIARELEEIRTRLGAHRPPDALRTGRVRAYRPPRLLPQTIGTRSRGVLLGFQALARRLGARWKRECARFAAPGSL